jgi:dihydroxyacid dehydratase/phosphogluconate dehydratase
MRGPCIGHVAPEALDGGPIALVEEGDLIEINAPERRLAIVGTGGEHRSPEEIEEILADRKRIWKAPQPRHDSGILALYSRVARSATEGASIT